MSLRLTTSEDVVALFDSVSGWAFGPTFATEDAATRFLDWTEKHGVRDGDVRTLDIAELYGLWERYNQETAAPDA